MAKIERDGAGGFSVTVRPHEQTAGDRVELAEQIASLVDAETESVAVVRLARRLVALLMPEEAKNANRSWLEGCVWATARASGLDWDRWRCAAVADLLRAQRGGWQQAIVRVADVADSPRTENH